jgi:uncharacterized phage protein (TIGR01671 family)
MIPKFRVWDKETKSMWNIERWHVEDEYFDLIEPDKSVVDPNAKRICRKQSDVIFMQSTWLFDNSMPKKEIFENDIVEWEHKDTGQLVRGIIKYDTEFGFWWMTDCRFNGLRSIGYLANQRVTVLGNICENKELVEE